jgi:hypothetical protein
MEFSSLQIQTDSQIGSGEELWVRFVKLNSDEGPGISVIFADPPTILVGYCMNAWQTFDMPGSDLKPRIWTFVKTATNIQLLCNGEQVIDANYAESLSSNCKPLWSLNFEQIKFMMRERTDTASDYYRQIPEGKFTY